MGNSWLVGLSSLLLSLTAAATPAWESTPNGGFILRPYRPRGQSDGWKGKRVEAVAYIRTSSAANVGADKDSDKQQRAAIEGFAKRSGFALVGEFTDAAVSGADPIETRPGFGALLDKIEGNGVRTVVVEDASHFARELMTQELGILALIQRGVRVLTANGDDLTDSTDPSRKMMRQIAGAFHEYEKARLVAKLKAARERTRAAKGKCEGRKSWTKINPELVREAKRLRTAATVLRLSRAVGQSRS